MQKVKHVINVSLILSITLIFIVGCSESQYEKRKRMLQLKVVQPENIVEAMSYYSGYVSFPPISELCKPRIYSKSKCIEEGTIDTEQIYLRHEGYVLNGMNNLTGYIEESMGVPVLTRKGKRMKGMTLVTKVELDFSKVEQQIAKAGVEQGSTVDFVGRITDATQKEIGKSVITTYAVQVLFVAKHKGRKNGGSLDKSFKKMKKKY